MSRGEGLWLRRSFLLLFCVWPVALHSSILFASPEWPARINGIAAGVGLLIVGIKTSNWIARISFAIIFLCLIGILALSPQFVLFAPPVMINGALAWVFAASLCSGRQPLIGVFASLEHGTLPQDLARHARVITWCWALLLASIAIISFALATWASMEVWSFFVNAVGYLLIGILFAGEYVYRRVRYRHYQHASLPAMIRNVRRVNFFARR
jgi:uncharacterized membrane protein